MNRTKGILVLAALLAVTALLITRGTRATVIPPPIKPDPIVKPIPVARKGPVALGSSLSGSHLVLGGAGEAYLDISLDIAQPLVSKSAPVNVALVIDRSGSMAGKKLIHARAAARKLVTSLRTGDRLALITYGSDVTTVVPSAAITSHSRRRILAAIEEISDRGGTYLSGGFEAGRDELLNNQRAGALNRIILISDGQANEGITSTSSLSTMAGKALSAGIHLTTMGVGLNFNENLMTTMAEHGGGHYYFIEDSEALAGIFAKELKTLTSAVASKATLAITLEPGVELSHLYGYSYRQNGQVITVKLPDLFGGQKRKVMCKLKVPTAEKGERTLAKVALSFAEIKSGDEFTLSTMARVIVTSDSEKVDQGRDRRVLARAEQANISANLKQAMDSYSDGDVSGAQARLRKQIAVSTEANEELKSSALDRILGKLKRQLKTSEEAAPASPAGRALSKGGKYDAYQMAK